jgi:fluoroquinolone resistance protein
LLNLKRYLLQMEPIFTDQTIEKKNLKEHPLSKGEYENCVFKYCDLSNADLSEFVFMDCEFVECNLSLAVLTKTSLRDVVFKNCKMLGLRFEHCNDFGLSIAFEKCTLDHSSFYQVKLKKTSFKGSQLHEVDFTESDLTASVFTDCDFTNATFDNTILEKADLRTSVNYSIDPETNRIKKAKFSLSGIAGLLDRYDIEIDRAG